MHQYAFGILELRCVKAQRRNRSNLMERSLWCLTEFIGSDSFSQISLSFPHILCCLATWHSAFSLRNGNIATVGQLAWIGILIKALAQVCCWPTLCICQGDCFGRHLHERERGTREGDASCNMSYVGEGCSDAWHVKHNMDKIYHTFFAFCIYGKQLNGWKYQNR